MDEQWQGGRRYEKSNSKIPSTDNGDGTDDGFLYRMWEEGRKE